jgi:hypothetical protein
VTEAGPLTLGGTSALPARAVAKQRTMTIDVPATSRRTAATLTHRRKATL